MSAHVEAGTLSLEAMMACRRSDSDVMPQEITATTIDRLQLIGRFDVCEQRFFDFAPLTWRHALVPMIGVVAEL